ncbi:sensor histidine kinase [Burkholderia diffusa]|uniref:sensor histidine kinase n=1 Tax=Burkholderia diffusa TaxID=488732 RepID=UPI002ABD5284|nr:sensor histidine kinase [Burkholderia diffusa]
MLVRVLLDNLVDNAIKYGREQRHVEITSWQDAGAIRLQVRDDGPGVSDEDLSRLQDRFFRDADQDESGSGLGLSIVARIAAKLGGSLTDIDMLNGSGFGAHVTLPSSA